MPKWILFATVCLFGTAALIYFADVSATQSLPAYSTLSTRQEGAKLLFDGLDGAGQVRVTRQFKSLETQPAHDATVLFLGMEPFSLQFAGASFFEQMESAASAGNRIVIAVIQPRKYPDAAVGHWGLRFASSALQTDKSWNALPDVSPQVWQRKEGRGDIILVGSAQRLNNRAVATTQSDRSLLLKLVAGHPLVIFEEAHLGIVESGSIAGLARHYRLQGLLAGLLLLAALFVWSRSVNFPPASPTADTPRYGSGSSTVMAELMSRHLKEQLIPSCVTEWNRTHSHSTPLQVPTGIDAVARYSALQQTLQEKANLRP